MATRREVSCINKRDHYNEHERIARIGGRTASGTNWSLSEDEAISGIKNGTYEFYVTKNGRSVDVVIAKHNGREYLKTENDGYAPNNLLGLPECSR